MVGVFGGFAIGDMSMFQQMGFGLAAAVIIDATLVRSILVPAIMVLLGDKNWYFPSWLEWLPRIDVDSKKSDDDERSATPVTSVIPAAVRLVRLTDPTFLARELFRCRKTNGRWSFLHRPFLLTARTQFSLAVCAVERSRLS
jgi:hypothetical protein